MPELRTETDPEDALAPVNDRDSRPETERREVDEREEARDERELLRTDALSRPPPSVPLPARRLVAEPVDAATGARPQVSQYSSPPPMSS
ncbi:hypothetical protein [Streptomyces sp. NBC_00690]|uniref:hypothetical protein n=1 Tax=Streptomyces sp. NBC_00690 TaxID=2975808 RepID=UPI003FA7DD01